MNNDIPFTTPNRVVKPSDWHIWDKDESRSLRFGDEYLIKKLWETTYKDLFMHYCLLSPQSYKEKNWDF